MCVVLDQPARDRGREQRVAAGDDANGVEELVGARVLEQEAARARAQSLVDVLVEVERCQDQYTRRGGPGGDPPGRFDPVEVGHADVHQHDVRPQRRGGLDRLPPVTGLSDYLDVGLGIQDHAEAGTDELLIVSDQNAHHERTPPARGRRTRTA